MSLHREFRHIRRHLERLAFLVEINAPQEQLMNALDNLTAAVGNLETTASSAEGEIATLKASTNPDDTAALTALTARLQAVTSQLGAAEIAPGVSVPTPLNPGPLFNPSNPPNPTGIDPNTGQPFSNPGIDPVTGLTFDPNRPATTAPTGTPPGPNSPPNTGAPSLANPFANPNPSPTPSVGALSVSPTSIAGAAGIASNQSLSVSGGTPPYSFVSSLADVAVDIVGGVTIAPDAARTGTITVTDSVGATATVSVGIA
jgi:hypothetical protein